MGAFPLRSIAIVGGDVSSWLAATTLRRVLGDSCQVTVIALPDESAISGVLAAVPSLHRLFGLLGIDELALMRTTRASYRLGSRFTGWGAPGTFYFQGFGTIGARLDAVPFQHHWLRLARTGDCAPFEDFSMAAQLARRDRFAPPHTDPRSVLSLYSYAWHFDARLLAAELRSRALAGGATELRGDLATVEGDAHGNIRALLLTDGGRCAADFFINCSGVDGLLAQHLGAGYVDWSACLPCDRLQLVRCGPLDPLPPYSDFETQPHGWRFTLPLQDSTFRGQVYSSAHASDEQIAVGLAAWAGVTGPVEIPAQGLLRGRPREFWVKNCLLIPGDRLDPLAGTALHLAQTGIARLLAHFPARADSPTDRAEYNRLTADEYDRIRDLLAFHYHACARDDSPFWRACRAATLPGTLADRIALFSDSARLAIGEEEHCGADGWLAVLLGQGVLPGSYDPLADGTPFATARDALAQMASAMQNAAVSAPAHRVYLARGAASR